MGKLKLACTIAITYVLSSLFLHLKAGETNIGPFFTLFFGLSHSQNAKQCSSLNLARVTSFLDSSDAEVLAIRTVVEIIRILLLLLLN